MVLGSMNYESYESSRISKLSTLHSERPGHPDSVLARSITLLRNRSTAATRLRYG